MTRRAVWIAVVGAVVLAGCMGGPGTSGSTNDEGNVTSAAVPGVENGTLTNATALAVANEDRLAAEGARIDIEHETPEIAASFQIVAGPEFETYELSGTQAAGPGGPAEIDIWSNESIRIVHTAAGGNESYRTVDRRDARPNGLDGLREYLDGAAFTVTNETTGNGTVVLTADDVARTDGYGRLADADTVDARLVVSESGLIHSLSVDATVDGESESYRFAVTETGVERVSPPGWVADLPASATLQPELTVDVEESSYLTITNEGGDAVPADTIVDITTNDTAGQATVDTPLGPGETQYLYVANATGAVSLADAQPSEADVDPLESPVSITIRTADGVTLHSSGMAWETGSASDEGSGSASGRSGGTSESASDDGTATQSDAAAD